MEISQNIRATRVTGTLDVALEDGRTATLEIDLDVSDPNTGWGVDHEYAEEPGFPYVRLGRRLSTTFSVRIPASLQGNSDPLFTFRVPTNQA